MENIMEIINSVSPLTYLTLYAVMVWLAQYHHNRANKLKRELDDVTYKYWKKVDEQKYYDELELTDEQLELLNAKN